MFEISGAHTTASDGMYGALPILTLPKDTLSSRVSAGLNEAVDLSFLNVESRKTYVDIAIALRDKTTAPLLFKIRSRILEALGTKIFNSTLFSSNLEESYRAALELLPKYQHLFFQREKPPSSSINSKINNNFERTNSV